MGTLAFRQPGGTKAMARWYSGVQLLYLFHIYPYLVIYRTSCNSSLDWCQSQNKDFQRMGLMTICGWHIHLWYVPLHFHCHLLNITSDCPIAIKQLWLWNLVVSRGGSSATWLLLQMSGTPLPFSTILPSPPSHSFMGCDNQWQRDLLGDLESVRRQWCSEHCLLKAESTASLLSYFLFISDLFILSSVWLCHVLLSHHHAYTLASAWLTHPPSLVIMLTLICRFCLLL